MPQTVNLNQNSEIYVIYSLMRRFNEFVHERDKAFDPTGIHQDKDELLRRLTAEHGASLRRFLKNGINDGYADDDDAFKKDLKQFVYTLKKSPQNDEYPPTDKHDKPQSELDVVTRPVADGGTSLDPQSNTGGGGE